MMSAQGRVWRMAYIEAIRLIHRPPWPIVVLYGVIWGVAHGLISDALGNHHKALSRVAIALGGPSFHSSFLTILTWVSLPIAFLLAVGSPVGETTWLRYRVLRQRGRYGVWFSIMGVRFALSMVFGLLVIVATVASIEFTTGAVTFRDIPWSSLISGVLGTIWWSDAILVALWKFPLALGLVLLANYGVITLISSGAFSSSFLAPALGPTLAASVTHHHLGMMMLWIIITFFVGYGVGFVQFSSANI